MAAGIEFIFGCDSLGGLMYLNEATLLNNVRARYEKDIIYVRVRVLYQITFDLL